MLGEPAILPIDGVDVIVGDRHDVGAVARAEIRLTARHDLDGLATGRFALPRGGVAWTVDRFEPEIELLGFAFTQFALPVVADASLGFDFAPGPGLRSPRAVSPLLARCAGRVTLLAPIDHPHEQVCAVDDGRLVWGWHGDLDRVPAGFTTRLGRYEGGSVTDVLAAWRRDVAPIGRGEPTNPLLTHLSYWTDNGAAYWYRTEAGRTIAESVVDVVEHLRAAEVPVHAVELDSWCYDHEIERPIAEIGYPSEVPPTGMLTWTPRVDAFPATPDDDGCDAIERFADRLGRPPLVIHARHLSPRSPYVAEPAGGEWWVDGLAAQPADPVFFRRWFDDAVRWGVVCIEQDWMLLYWFGVRELRAVPGRAAAWQLALDEHAGATGVDLLWCMATPADLVLAAQLEHVVAVRTCDDYRFADDPAFLWTWFLTVNRLAATLGLAAFKDCFFSNAEVDPDDDPIDGDPHAEVEAVLSALSAGPVGIGDRIGRTDRDLVLRTCDDDGRLRHVDAPIALIDDCLFGSPARGERLAWATTTATIADGSVVTYVLAINTAADRRIVEDRIDLVREAGVRPGDVVADWSTEHVVEGPVLELHLGPRDWALFVCGPPEALERGDREKFVTVRRGR